MMQIHFAMAKKSSDDNSQFVKRDIKSKLLKGELPGTVPLGFLNIDRAGRITPAQYSPQKQQILEQLERPLKREEIDPIDGKLLRMLFEEASKGVYTLAGLQNYAQGIGLETRNGKKKLSKCVLTNLLSNPYFYGAIRYQGKIYNENIQHDPLISRELFDRVQHALARKSKGRHRRHQFSYSGLMRCGECGCAITAEWQKGHVYYHCTYKKGSCDQRKWIREEQLQEQLLCILTDLSIPEAFIKPACDKVRELHKSEAKSSESVRRKLQSQYNACKQKLDGLLQLKISPNNVSGELLSDEEYLAQKRALNEDLESIQSKLGAIHGDGTQWIDDCQSFVEALINLPDNLAMASCEEKRGVILLVCSNLVLKDCKVTAEYQEPFATIAKFPLAGANQKARLESSDCNDTVSKTLEKRPLDPNLCIEWQARKDLNLRPLVLETSALAN